MIVGGSGSGELAAGLQCPGLSNRMCVSVTGDYKSLMTVVLQTRKSN